MQIRAMRNRASRGMTVLQLLLGNCTEISKCTILVLKLGLKINEAYVGKLQDCLLLGGAGIHDVI